MDMPYIIETDETKVLDLVYHVCNETADFDWSYIMIDIFSNKPDAAVILDNANGTVTVVLRKNIVQDTADQGPDGASVTFWKCDYVSKVFVKSQAPTIDYINEHFDEVYVSFESDNVPDVPVDEQLQAIARLQVATMDLLEITSSEVVKFRDYWPEWQPDTEYGFQQPLRHKGLYYRVSRALTSSKTYPPDTAGESMYYPVEIAPDGIIVYRACHGAYDVVQKGETRHYPNADGPVYRSLVDNNAFSPDTVSANWELA